MGRYDAKFDLDRTDSSLVSISINYLLYVEARNRQDHAMSSDDYSNGFLRRTQAAKPSEIKLKVAGI